MITIVQPQVEIELTDEQLVGISGGIEHGGYFDYGRHDYGRHDYGRQGYGRQGYGRHDYDHDCYWYPSPVVRGF